MTYTTTPWGSWEVLEECPHYKVKRIMVKPLQRFSYQRHFKREENWVIVQGLAEVTLDDKVTRVAEGDFVHIPRGGSHRIKNISENLDLVFIEVQRGDYLGEDDIERLADDYGRK